jgi:intracellular sulfur oxidation DsrE/DsrF family protein
MSRQTPSSPERRSFFTGMHAGASSLAALALGGIATAQVKSAPTAPFQPLRHAQDDWMDQVPGKHRLLIDTTSAEGFREGLLYAENFLVANHDDYGLQSQDLAVIVVARHLSTGYGYNSDMWAKYGASLSDERPSADVPAKEAPKVNLSAKSLESLAKQGVQFAVCSMATRYLAGMIARAAGGNADATFAELSSNLVGNGRLVPAGIVAVSRAQERGYSVVRG